MSMTTGAVCLVSSMTSVGIPSSMLGDEILSRLTTSEGQGCCCSLPCECGGALTLLRGHLQARLDTPILGGAMVVTMFSTELNWICNLCKFTLCSIYSIDL
jgi:hypothetical protein